MKHHREPVGNEERERRIAANDRIAAKLARMLRRMAEDGSGTGRLVINCGHGEARSIGYEFTADERTDFTPPAIFAGSQLT